MAICKLIFTIFCHLNRNPPSLRRCHFAHQSTLPAGTDLWVCLTRGDPSTLPPAGGCLRHDGLWLTLEAKTPVPLLDSVLGSSRIVREWSQSGNLAAQDPSWVHSSPQLPLLSSKKVPQFKSHIPLLTLMAGSSIFSSACLCVWLADSPMDVCASSAANGEWKCISGRLLFKCSWMCFRWNRPLEVRQWAPRHNTQHIYLDASHLEVTQAESATENDMFV